MNITTCIKRACDEIAVLLIAVTIAVAYESLYHTYPIIRLKMHC